MKTKTQLRSLESIGARSTQYYRDTLGFRAHSLGDPSKQRTVLINCGWASVPELYTNLAERLSKDGLAVVILSLRGVGENPLGKSTPSTYIQTSVEDSLHLLKSLNVRELILMPHSTGAQVALKLIDQLPSEVVVKGCILNAPSLPDTLAAFPTKTILNKVGKLAAKVFLKMVSLGVKEDQINWFAKFSAKLATWVFRLCSPLMVLNAYKESRKLNAEFWRTATKQSSETLAVSLAALANCSGELTSQVRIDAPSVFIGYEFDTLVDPELGMNSASGYVLGKHSRAIKLSGACHFDHEIRFAEISGEVNRILGD